VPPTVSLPSSMDPATVNLVQIRLASIRETEGVAIPLAIESGSRAWGFPSPDSDYDYRFVFVRPVEHYLSPWPRRDVIETPIEGDLDVNGWELGKAIRLLMKGNAVIIEWLTSPIAYGVDEVFRRSFLNLAEQVADRNLVARHYLHLGFAQRNRRLAARASIPLKAIFYTVRPAAALRWLRQRPGESVAPMRFQTLIEECAPPADVVCVLDDLLARKAETRELGEAPLPEPIARFIDEEFRAGEEAFPKRPSRAGAQEQERAEAFFRATVDHVWSSSGGTTASGTPQSSSALALSDSAR